MLFRSQTPSTPHGTIGSPVGFVSGDRSGLVIKEMTVEEHVALPAIARFARAGFVSRRQQHKWVKRSLDTLSVIGTPDAPMTSLSGGNQQRALMSRWVETEDVDVLVVDQPTVGVDIAGRAQLLGVLRELAKTRGVVVIAEPDELAVVADRVLCLRRGAISTELAGTDVTEERILSALA